MFLKRIGLSLMLGLSGIFFLTGCSGARFVTAKVKTIDIDTVGDFNHLKNLVRDENLPAADESKADHLRENAQDFHAYREKDLEIQGDRNGQFTIYMLAQSGPSISSTFPLPVQMAIYTSTPHQKGERTGTGYAQISFGDEGPIYRTDLNDCFFEFEVSDIYQQNGDSIASGKFSLIARNKDDLQDKTRLMVMDGAFIARIK